MRLYVNRCWLRALRPIRKRESHTPGLPVQRVLYKFVLLPRGGNNFLNIDSDSAFTVLAGNAFQFRILDGKKDLPVDTNLVDIFGI